MAQHHGGVNGIQQLPQQLHDGSWTGSAGIVLRHKHHTLYMSYLHLLLKPLARNAAFSSSLTSNPKERKTKTKMFDL